MSAYSQAKQYLRTKGYELPSVMNGYISEWKGWYMGANNFYTYREVSESRTYVYDRKTLYPARWVANQWASLLFNENTEIVSDDEAANLWLEAYLNKAGFLGKGQALVETGFALGTAAWSLRFGGLNEHELKSPNASVYIQRHDAEQIIPLTYDEDTLTDVAFISSCVIGGKEYAQLSIHELGDNGYTVTVLFFDKHGLVTTGREGIIETGSDIPLFGIVKPALDNIYDPLSPMGRSIYDDAIDAIKMVDLCWDNMYKDVYLGQTIVFVSDTLLDVDANGKTIIPREKDQQIFRKVAGDGGSASSNIETFQPSLRISENSQAITEAIDKLSMRCGFGKGYLNASRINKTATEVISDNADLFNHLKTHQNQLAPSLRGLGDALLWSATNVLGIPLAESTVDVRFADSIVDDSQAQRAQDLADVGAGLMQPYEYRVKWYGEGEEEAKNNVSGPIESVL